MYFDVDHNLEISELRLEDAFASAAQEISERRGRVIAVSKDILVFSAPFWRVNGLLYFFVRQLPIGVSHGVMQRIERNGVCMVRLRISLLWLRLCIAAIVLLLVPALLTPDAGDKTVLLSLLAVSVVGGGLIYMVAVVEARKYFTKILLCQVGAVHAAPPRPAGGEEDQPARRSP